MAPKSAKVHVLEGMEEAEERAGNDAAAFESVQAFLDVTSGYKGWGDMFSTDGLKLVSASSSPIAKTVFEFQVKSNHINGMKNLHGGCCATLFDWCTTTALVLVSKKGFWRFKGVSRTLNVTYLRPVPEGEVVLIESELVHAGKNLCTIKGAMKRKSDGAILAICEHGKVNIDPDAKSRL